MLFLYFIRRIASSDNYGPTRTNTSTIDGTSGRRETKAIPTASQDLPWLPSINSLQGFYEGNVNRCMISIGVALIFAASLIVPMCLDPIVTMNVQYMIDYYNRVVNE